RVLEVVRDERRGVVAVRRLDLGAPVLAREELPAPEDRLRRRLEPVVLEADERGAEEGQAVQHEPAAEDRARLAREGLVAPDVQLVLGPPEGAAEPVAPAEPQHDAQVELADVPARQHVGVDGADVGEEALDARPLVAHDLGARDVARVDEEDALPARAGARDRVEPGAVEARLDIEGEHAERRREVRGRERRVAIDAADAGPALPRTLDREAAPDAPVDEVAVGEAEVRLEAGDARLAEPRAERR